MAIRRPLWSRSCLNRPAARPSVPRAVRAAPGATPAPLERRCLATHATTSSERPHFTEFLPPSQPTELDSLLRAIQAQDSSRVRRSFKKLTDRLAEALPPLPEEDEWATAPIQAVAEPQEAIVIQVQELSAATFSEILRSLDPLVSSHDVAKGLNISLGHSQYTDMGKHVDEFGVRSHHRQVLLGMLLLLRVRSEAGIRLMPQDYEVMVRCAGAGADYQAAKEFFTAMAPAQDQHRRTVRTWTEFIKARFRTEPLYYQFDRSRVAVTARDMKSSTVPQSVSSLKRLDSMRLSINSLKSEPWNRRYDELDEDLRRQLRRRDYRGFQSYWVRGLYYGLEVDEELLCASMIAFSRSNSVSGIQTLILENYYGIKVEKMEDSYDVMITGGNELPPDSPLHPTPRLLNAVVEAFASMSQISLATKLLLFISSRYNLPIPAETWSNLLNWTYVCQSKPSNRARKIRNATPATDVSPFDVRYLWETMTAAPYNVKPTFEDCNVYIKALIQQRSFGRAIVAIASHAIPHYRAAEEAYEAALTDEILQSAALGFPSPRARTRRQTAEALKDHTREGIKLMFVQFLKSASAVRFHREGSMAQVFIPDLVEEFGEFMPPSIKYRTAQGTVVMDRADAAADERFAGWERRVRTTLPQKLSGYRVHNAEDAAEPDFPYPMARDMTVAEWKRRPKRRAAEVGVPPEQRDEAWWSKVEAEMSL